MTYLNPQEGGANPGGVDDDLQFNDGGSFGGFGQWDGTKFRLDTTEKFNINAQVADDVSLVADSGAVQIGNHLGNHIAFDRNTIQAKSNGTTASTININDLGGTVLFGNAIALTNFIVNSPEVGLGNFVFDTDQAVGAGQDNFVLTYDDGTGRISLEAAAGGGSPGGSDTELQYNNGGAFGGITELTYNDATGKITFTGSHDVGSDGMLEVVNTSTTTNQRAAEIRVSGSAVGARAAYIENASTGSSIVGIEVVIPSGSGNGTAILGQNQTTSGSNRHGVRGNTQSTGSFSGGVIGDAQAVTGQVFGGEFFCSSSNAAAYCILGLHSNSNLAVNICGNNEYIRAEQTLGGTLAFNLDDNYLQLDVSQDIVLNEKADHASLLGAGYGHLWVRNDNPNVLVFTDDSGVDTVLGAGGGGSPGGATTNVQFNNTGAFDGDAEFLWDTVGKVLTIIDGGANGQVDIYQTATAGTVEADLDLDLLSDGTIRVHTGGEGFTISTRIDSDLPHRISAASEVQIDFADTAATAGNQNFRIINDSEEFAIQLFNDAFTVGANAFAITRTANAIDQIRMFPEDTIDIPNGAGFFLAERSDHFNTPTASRGELWIRDDTIQHLIFTDDDGVDNEIASTHIQTPIARSGSDDRFENMDGAKWVRVDIEDYDPNSVDDIWFRPQYGSGTVQTTGYNSYCLRQDNAGNTTLSTATNTFPIVTPGATGEWSGSLMLSLVDETNNIWYAHGEFIDTINDEKFTVTGTVNMTQALTGIRINNSSATIGDTANLYCSWGK